MAGTRRARLCGGASRARRQEVEGWISFSTTTPSVGRLETFWQSLKPILKQCSNSTLKHRQHRQEISFWHAGRIGIVVRILDQNLMRAVTRQNPLVANQPIFELYLLLHRRKVAWYNAHAPARCFVGLCFGRNPREAPPRSRGRTDRSGKARKRTDIVLLAYPCAGSTAAQRGNQDPTTCCPCPAEARSWRRHVTLNETQFTSAATPPPKDSLPDAMEQLTSNGVLAKAAGPGR